MYRAGSGTLLNAQYVNIGARITWNIMADCHSGRAPALSGEGGRLIVVSATRAAVAESVSFRHLNIGDTRSPFLNCGMFFFFRTMIFIFVIIVIVTDRVRVLIVIVSVVVAARPSSLPPLPPPPSHCRPSPPPLGLNS